MLRSSVLSWLAVVIATGTAGVARAEATSPTAPTIPGAAGPRVVVPTPLEQYATPHAQASSTLYLERCTGGCTVTKGINDARIMSSTIPATSGSHTVSEYKNGNGETGAAADAEWALLMQCMREVYSPFKVTVTDVKPVSGVSYHAAIVAGVPNDVGLGNDILGIAPLASDCSAQDNVISFSFANAHPQTETVERVQNLCWTVAQESAHAYGLDHEFAFVSDNRSACNDPMTYRVDCGGQKFFRNEAAACGEFSTRPCRCGATQNSHLKLLNVFGEGTSLIPPPSVAIVLPQAGGALGSSVAASAGSPRGVAKVELRLNGYAWAEAQGAAFGASGQPDPSTYTIQVPSAVPNSVIDVVVRAYDDLGLYSDSEAVTVTKGAPCTTADTCATGQKCEGGKCFWDPPTGELGDDCTYPQFCLSGMCQGTAEQQICTQTCIPGVGDSCPDGLACIQTAPGKGVCFLAEDDGGCCSTGGGSGAPWAQLGFAAMTLGLLARRRRRRRR